MIDENDIEAICLLQTGEIAFPIINYNQMPPLNLPRTTLLGAYTTISKRVDETILEGLEWNNQGDIVWQNNMLEHLYGEILNMIENQEHNNESRTKIFVWIQLWGANSGRGIFVRGNGWPDNFDLEIYSHGVQLVQLNQPAAALNYFNQLKYMGTAFSTKHMHFWSNCELPIFDSIISEIVFGRKNPKIQDYIPYIQAVDEIIELNQNITRAMFERNLFNWASTPNGMHWRNIRLGRINCHDLLNP